MGRQNRSLSPNFARARTGWRKLPWDWRVRVAAGFVHLIVLAVLILTWTTGEGNNRCCVPAGPFLVPNYWQPIYWSIWIATTVVELVGLLFLQRWVWSFGFAVSALGTVETWSSFVSGAAYRAYEMGGSDLYDEGGVVFLGGLAVRIFIFGTLILVWRFFRRNALLQACETKERGNSRDADRNDTAQEEATDDD